jgi:hypothetical protein
MRLNIIFLPLIIGTFLQHDCLAQPKEVFENPYPLKIVIHQCLHSTIISDSKTLYLYDSQHRLKRKEEINNGKVRYFTDYIYNQKGLLEKQVYHKVDNNSDQIESFITYAYDQKGYLTELITTQIINGASSPTKETFEYKDYQLIKRSRYHYQFNKWFILFFDEYEYKGELLSKLSQYQGKDQLHYSTLFTYQDSKLIQTETINENGLVRTEPYEYNQEGYLVRKVRNELQYEEYDWQNGRLVSKKEVDLNTADREFSPCGGNTIEVYSYYE